MSIVNFLNNVNLKNLNTTASVTLTATTSSVTKGCFIYIPANTFTSGDVIQLSTGAGNSTGGDFWNTYYYWNTANTITGAVKLANTIVDGETSGSNILFLNFVRTYHIVTSDGTTSGTTGLSTSSFTSQDFTSSSGFVAPYALNWLVDSYLMVGFDTTTLNQTIKNVWFKVSTF